MKIIPAIDIMHGKAVRLQQGDFSREEIVGQDVVKIAQQFEKQGATYCHIVDLEGAKCGRCVSRELIIQLRKTVNLKMEVGGGIRTIDDIAYYLDHGIERVIVSTIVLSDPNFLKEALSRYGDRIVVGMDCKEGFVSVSGWQKTTKVSYLDFAKTMQEEGASTLIFTDISTDGMLSGPNLSALKKLRDSVDIKLIASGGIHTIEDLVELDQLGVQGAILGKSLYANTIDLKQAVQLEKER